MKAVLRVASVLTWFNIIVWGLIVGFGFLGVLFLGQLPYAAGFVLLSAIPLNCYAALKLHTSIRYPSVPLNHQTPVGLRFVGMMSLFFGIYLIYSGIAILANPKPEIEVFKQQLAQMPQQPDWVGRMADVFTLGTGIAGLILGFLVVVNVVLNLRLLRWYYLVHKSDAS
ncbi:MAG TPA: hypothetical protein VFE32_14450 [Puia sp.]|jgi:hypothetical protein|nr:hypothetical protein [Puia sp.]